MAGIFINKNSCIIKSPHPNLVLNYWRVDRLVTSLAVNRYANAFTLCSLVLNAALPKTSFASLTLAKIRSPSREGNVALLNSFSNKCAQKQFKRGWLHYKNFLQAVLFDNFLSQHLMPVF